MMSDDFIDIDFPEPEADVGLTTDGADERGCGGAADGVSREDAKTRNPEAARGSEQKATKSAPSTGSGQGKPAGRVDVGFDDGDWERSAKTVVEFEAPGRGGKGGKRGSFSDYEERTAPHDLRLEQGVISCVLLTGDVGTLALCQSEGVSSDVFYSPKHQLMWEAICDIFEREGQCDELMLRDELVKGGRFEEIGGDAYLFEVTGQVSTPAYLPSYCASVMEYHARREYIRLGNRLVEASFEAKDGEDITRLGQDFERAVVHQLQRSGGRVNALRPPTDFAIPESDSDEVLLGKNRWVSRGDGVIVFANAGVGKSSWQTLAALHFACGMEFVGIPCPRPLRSLIVQKEDNDGDVAESIESFFHQMLQQHGQTVAKECVDMVRENVRIVRNMVNAGDTLLAALAGYTAQFQPDLLWLNPLVSYAGCSVTDEATMQEFLNGLNRVNRDSQWATIVIHHTPKPPADKEAKNRSWNEEMYAMGGSYVIPGWARAVISLKATGERGRFKMILAKRGARCGIRRPRRIGADSQGNPLTEPGEVVTEVPIKHGQGHFHSHTAKKDVPLIAWEIESGWINGEREAEPDTTENKGGRRTKHNPAEVLKWIGHAYEENRNNGMSMNQYHKFVEENMDISRGSFVNVWKALIEDGAMVQDGLGKFFVPAQTGTEGQRD